MWPLQGTTEFEGEKHKLGGNWSDRKAPLAHGRTMCRGRYEKEVTPYHWGFPKSAFQCILSDQGKKSKPWWWHIYYSTFCINPNKVLVTKVTTGLRYQPGKSLSSGYILGRPTALSSGYRFIRCTALSTFWMTGTRHIKIMPFTNILKQTEHMHSI